jgi:hypothetical protein
MRITLCFARLSNVTIRKSTPLMNEQEFLSEPTQAKGRDGFVGKQPKVWVSTAHVSSQQHFPEVCCNTRSHNARHYRRNCVLRVACISEPPHQRLICAWDVAHKASSMAVDLISR